MKISALTNQDTVVASDYVPFLDTSDITQSTAGSTRKTQLFNIIQGSEIAKATGVNDGTQFNELIAKIKARGGGKLFSKAGGYKLNVSVLLCNNLEWEGEYGGTILQATNGLNADLLMGDDGINGNSNILLSKLKIDGNKSNQSTDSSALSLDGTTTHGRNVLLEKLWVINTHSMGLHPKRTDNLAIDKCIFENIGTSTLHHGIYLLACDDASIAHCKASGGAGNGFNAKQGNRIEVSTCDAYNNAGSGIRLADYNIATAKGNTCASNGSIGIDYHLEISTGVNKATIGGNVCANNVGIGIVVNNGTDVALAGNSSCENGQHGIDVRNSRRISIVGNTANNNSSGTNNTYSGIYLEGTSSDITVTGNIAKKSTIQQKYGLEIVDTVDGVNAAVNDFQNNQTGAVSNTSSGTNNKIRNNYGYVTENSGIATIASGSTSIVITHGLSVTPSLKDISIALGENPTSDPGNIWIDTITSTQFTINCRNNPGVSNLDLAWRAIVL